ncbi:MAG: hypothetical protein KAS07_01795 [Candidatus Pacebacteria bacterium]|nr:hypothetical protein [Candidatus Paceibacterota bacterium]
MQIIINDIFKRVISNEDNGDYFKAQDELEKYADLVNTAIDNYYSQTRGNIPPYIKTCKGDILDYGQFMDEYLVFSDRLREKTETIIQMGVEERFGEKKLAKFEDLKKNTINKINEETEKHPNGYCDSIKFEIFWFAELCEAIRSKDFRKHNRAFIAFKRIHKRNKVWGEIYSAVCILTSYIYIKEKRSRQEISNELYKK